MESRSRASLRAGSPRHPQQSPKKSPGFIRRSAAPARRTKWLRRFASSLRPKLPISPDKSWWSMEGISFKRTRAAELAADRLPESRRWAKLARASQSLDNRTAAEEALDAPCCIHSSAASGTTLSARAAGEPPEPSFPASSWRCRFRRDKNHAAAAAKNRRGARGRRRDGTRAHWRPQVV